MEKHELNRDIKRLAGNLDRFSAEAKRTGNNDIYFSREPALKKEYERLYGADDDFEYMNKTSILLMIRMNLRLRVIPLHQFGNKIKI